MELIRVFLIDNEEVFREGVAKILTEQPHIQVIYHGSSTKEAIASSTEAKRGVVLVNSQVSEGGGLEAIKEISTSMPEAKVVMMSRPELGDNLVEALKAGARAFLAKSISAADLVKSIELISSGRIIVSPIFADKFLEDIARRKIDENATDTEIELIKDGRVTIASMSTQKSMDQIIGRRFDETAIIAKTESEVSDREMDVVKLIVQGNSNKEIAQRLFITENTVKVHVKNILNKLELKNRQQLAAYAVLKDWVSNNTDTVEKDTNPGT